MVSVSNQSKPLVLVPREIDGLAWGVEGLIFRFFVGGILKNVAIILHSAIIHTVDKNVTPSIARVKLKPNRRRQA